MVVCQYYYPEPVRITDICEELVKQGNEITVLTGVPNYPMGNIYNGYKLFNNKDEVINGVKIKRCFTIPRKKGKVTRLLNYISFPLSSASKIRKLEKDFDIVLVNQLSPVIMANAGIKYKKKNNIKLVLYCLDLWPESLLVGGVSKKSILYKFFYKLSEKIYTKADSILIGSHTFEDYLLSQFKIERSKIKFLPQYAETIFTPEECKKEEDENIDILFAGNIGKAQSMDTILEAACRTQTIKNLKWHIVGDGIEYERCLNKIKEKNTKNIKMYGRKSIEEMPKIYKKADAMLVSLCGDSFVSNTLPGKVQSYMAAGKPIIGAANGETKIVIKEAKCGYCGPADDYKTLVSNVKKFIRLANKKELGVNSYNYYKENYSKEKFITKLLNELERNMEE